jgi:prepilin-type N-terminal cleavage/methylation domain-containing protein
MVWNNLRSKKLFSAFTLIEVIIVVAIIAILIIAAIWAYRTQILKGFDSRRKTDMYQIKVALEEYEKDHNCYPTAVLYREQGEEILKPYIPFLPKDPRTKEDYVYTPQSDTGCPKWYWLFTSLENTADADSAKLGCQSGCGSGGYTYYVSSYNAPEPERTISSPLPSGPGATTPPGVKYFGCFSGVCKEISNPPNCQPNWTDTCQLGCNEGNECIPI